MSIQLAELISRKFTYIYLLKLFTLASYKATFAHSDRASKREQKKNLNKLLLISKANVKKFIKILNLQPKLAYIDNLNSFQVRLVECLIILLINLGKK